MIPKHLRVDLSLQVFGGVSGNGKKNAANNIILLSGGLIQDLLAGLELIQL